MASRTGVVVSEQDVVSRIEPWVKVAGWMKGLFIAGFVISGWVTALQFQVTATSSDIQQIRAKQTADDARVEALRDIALETRSDVKWIKESLGTR